MRHPRTRSVVGMLVAGVALAGAVGADVPDVISYQGALLGPGGQPVDSPTSLRFRIFRGGDDQTYPSAGVLAYHERTTVTPASGVFSHLIGTGSPADDCPSGPCVLDADVFGPGSVPMWIEVTIDPDGFAGTPDDDVLLPRTRIGTVGYAYRVASLDGATGGAISGNLAVAGTVTAAALAATTQITGPNVTSGVNPGHTHTGYAPNDPDLADLADGVLTGSKVEPASATSAGAVTTGVQTFSGWKTFSGKVTLADETTLTTGRGFVQQAAPTFPGGQIGGAPGAGVKLRMYVNEPVSVGADTPGSVPGDDTEFAWVGPYYNSVVGDPLSRENPDDYSLGFQFTAGYTHVSGDRRALYAWRHITAGGATWYPFVWNLSQVHTSNPLMDYTIHSSPGRIALQVNDTSVSVRGSSVGKGDLELSGESGTLYLGGSTGGRLKFEGPTNDAFQLEVTARNPTTTRTQHFPNATGVFQVVPGTTTNAGTVMWGNSDDATDTGSEVCGLAGLICVDVKTVAGADSDCSTDQGANPTYFYALCRS